MWLDKAQTWALADYYGHLETIREQTLTCYNGIQGDGCGECAACHLRSKGLDYYLSHKESVLASLKNSLISLSTLLANHTGELATFRC